ncbi:uncharacterized protein LOC108114212 [Drosophila eugracilis]|uniref:uncharacterized protein LOC108114212 n=1 Tax=Drosophila eugracilis TaxID=29029 RepID=UPI0007E6AF58|nr:uncharacterized protein LOC108114212 [Drosophila eugracilis]
MENSTEKKYSCVSRYERRRELSKRRLLFWAGRLHLMPHEVARMSEAELNHRLCMIKKKDIAFDQRRADFERWKQINQLRFLMYEEQKKYNELCGPGGASIWSILSVAQRDLENKLQMDRLRGNCERFPSPMSIMEENRQLGGRQLVLEPLRSILSGCDSDSEDELELKKVTQYLPTRWPKGKGYTNISNSERSQQTFYEESFSKSKFNLQAKREDSLESFQDRPKLCYCPLCAKRHLRLPPRF